MNIKSAQYLEDEFKAGTKIAVKATIDGVEMTVPIDAKGNRHWIAIQKWVAEGNTIAEAD